MWMSDEIEAVTEGAKAVQEVAKTTGKAVDLAQAGGSYLAQMLGTVPEDVVGLLGGDYLRHIRIRNWHRIGEKTFRDLKDRGVKEPRPLDAKHIVPLLEAASHESDETLQDLWAQLLANAMDPSSDVSLQRVLIDTLRQFEPIDAAVLGYYATADNPGFRSPSQVAKSMDWRPTECAVSVQRLEALSCLDNIKQHVGRPPGLRTEYQISALGTELGRACMAKPE